MGVPEERIPHAFELLDRRDKLDPDEFTAGAQKLGLDEARVARFDQTCRQKYRAGDLQRMRDHTGIDKELADLDALDAELGRFGIGEWCEYDLGIVRGLAYYTGTVFEVHETSGALRAMAGGGRYDQLIELFGGPHTPAVGFGMGDVVLSNVLMDKGLMPEDVTPRPDVLIVAATDAGAAQVAGLAARLRRAGVHARFSYKTTRNLGKLLKDADLARARHVAILDDKIAEGTLALKDLATGEQVEVAVRDLAKKLLQA
jgi:histidyl-tRNA synthetase